jgi:hypothetical protein
MSRLTRIGQATHSLLVRTYPSEFRHEFEEEMRLDFADAMRDAARQGRKSVLSLFLREVRDWLATMPAEHWSGIWSTRAVSDEPRRMPELGGDAMDVTELNAGPDAPNGRARLLTVLPPMMFGWAIALSAMLQGGPWKTVPAWRMALSLSLILLFGVVICAGTLVALKRGLPDWGYTWLGSFLVSLLLLTNVVANELADSGRHIVSPAVETTIGLLLVLMLLAALVVSATRGWQRAGLLSIGLAGTMGLSLLDAVTVAPFYRHDLALLAAPLGVVFAALIHIFTRHPTTGRLAVLAIVAVINTGLAWMANLTWSDWFIERNQPPLIWPLLMILTGLLLVGPLFGLLARPIRPLLHRG